MDFFLTFILFSLSVFGITSGILYSELFKKQKENWIIYWDKSRYFNLLKYYGICQLCLGVPIGIFTEWFFLPVSDIATYILIAIASSSIGWILGSITLFCLNGKYALEVYTKNNKILENVNDPKIGF